MEPITTVKAANAVIIVLRSLLDTFYGVTPKDNIEDAADTYRGAYLTWLFTNPTPDEIHYLTNIITLTREVHDVTYINSPLNITNYEVAYRALCDVAYYMELHRQANGIVDDDDTLSGTNDCYCGNCN